MPVIGVFAVVLLIIFFFVGIAIIQSKKIKNAGETNATLLFASALFILIFIQIIIVYLDQILKRLPLQ